MKKFLFSIAFLGFIAVSTTAQNSTDSNSTNPENKNSYEIENSEEGALSDFLSQILQEQHSQAVTHRSGLAVGFISTIHGSFDGVQVGFINTVTNDARGTQVGFINTVAGGFNGAQVSFINTAANDTRGTQVGFINTVRGGFSGAQVSFINTATNDTKGAQVGFINTVRGEVDGAQIGFINTATGEVDAQIGFINTARKLNGLQLGFINYADTVESGGVPIGFLSIVRRGGYKAIEYSASEFHLVNIGLKLGVERFYTTIFVAYNPFEESRSKSFATGVGFGTIVPINDSFFFNPEINYLSSISRNNRQLTSFVPYFGYKFSDCFSITVAPSLTWSQNHNGNVDLLEPMFHLANFEINDKNALVIGARLSARWRF
jgi:hypothetical protein